MTSETYRGVVRGGRVVLLDGNPPWTDGTEVVVIPVTTAPGTPAAVLTAMQVAPPVPSSWVDELEALMAAGQRPPSRHDPFGDENCQPEGS
jgi:hypothetical protein